MSGQSDQEIAGDEFLSRKEAAKLITRMGFSMSPVTLSHMAANNNAGKGPPFVRFGWSQVKYRRRAVEAWVKSKMEEVT